MPSPAANPGRREKTMVEEMEQGYIIEIEYEEPETAETAEKAAQIVCDWVETSSEGRRHTRK